MHRAQQVGLSEFIRDMHELSFPVEYLHGVVLQLIYRAQVCVAVHPEIG